MARSPDFDLAKELGRPSFTPGARDAPALAALIIAGTEPAASHAAAALARLGPAARAAIAERLTVPGAESDRGPAPGNAGMAADADAIAATPSNDREHDAASSGDRKRGAARSGDRKRGAAPSETDRRVVDEGAHARLIAALGLLARAGDAEAAAQLIAATKHGASRVRRAAAVALGKLGGDDARAALLARWDASDAAPDERRALAEALGKVGGDDALARLRSLGASDDAELTRRRDRAILMADRTARRDEASIVVGDVAPAGPLAIQLTCRPGLGGLLVDELAALGLRGKPLQDRGATLALASPLSSLFASRLWSQLAIPLPLATGDLATAIVATITAPATRALLASWTRGAIRWRLGFAEGHKRAIVWRVARDVTARAPELINDPTATTWDFLVDAGTLVLVPRRLDDPRFAYRVADVPAASHPTVAAALAWLAAPQPSDRAWDPFCGSGLELVELARRASPRALLGTDVDPTALAAARANLDAAHVNATLVEADARTHAPGPLDLILTNPPLGSRVQLDAAALLTTALPNFARALAPRGRLVWITPVPRRTTPVAEQLGLHRSHALPVDLGGVRGQLERWERR